jgi:hypothetical protein
MRVALLSVLLFALGTATAQAAPPANDDFSAAAPLAVGEELLASNLGATAEPGEPDTAGVAKDVECSTLGGAPDCASSVWYRFEPAVPGQYTIETCDLGTDLASGIGVFAGVAIAAVTQVAGDEGSCAGGSFNGGSRVTFAAAAGVVYRVAVVGYHGDQGSFYLRAYAGAAQARPEPDTGIVRVNSSFAQGLLPTGLQVGVVSGSRHSASFALQATQAGASYQCSLDEAAFAPCASPVSYGGLAPGSSHTFAARAVTGAAVDPTPAVQRFTLDLAPPETNLVSGPQGATTSTSATWEVTGSEPNPGRYGYLCRMDGAIAGECPHLYRESSLCRGPHTFSAAAVDSAGNVDPRPVVAQVDVTAGPACAPPTLGASVARNIKATRAEVSTEYHNLGPRGTIEFEYGTTAAYGMTLPLETAVSTANWVEPAVTSVLRFLDPATTYHYRVTISTPLGTVSSADRTFTTGPLVGALPTIAVGTPSVNEHAAAIPVVIDPRAGEAVTTYEMRIWRAEQPGASATIGGGSIPALAGTRSVRIQVVDLDPCTTYRYRVTAIQQDEDENQVASLEGTFTTPPSSGAAGAGTRPSLPAQARGKAKGLSKCKMPPRSSGKAGKGERG